MFKATHRTTYTEKAISGATLGVPVKKHILTQVEYPSTLEDLASLEDGSLTLNLPLAIDWAGTMEVCVGYEKDADKWVGVYRTLPTPVALIVESLKLRINAVARPAGEATFTSEELESFFTSQGASAEIIRQMYNTGGAKSKATLKPMIEKFLGRGTASDSEVSED